MNELNSMTGWMGEKKKKGSSKKLLLTRVLLHNKFQPITADIKFNGVRFLTIKKVVFIVDSTHTQWPQWMPNSRLLFITTKGFKAS